MERDAACVCGETSTRNCPVHAPIEAPRDESGYPGLGNTVSDAAYRHEEQVATEQAAHRLLRAAGFFRWGHDAWCHDEAGIGCVTTAEALDAIQGDDRLAAILGGQRV